MVGRWDCENLSGPGAKDQRNKKIVEEKYENIIRGPVQGMRHPNKSSTQNRGRRRE